MNVTGLKRALSCFVRCRRFMMGLSLWVPCYQQLLKKSILQRQFDGAYFFWLLLWVHTQLSAPSPRFSIVALGVEVYILDHESR